MRNHVVFKFLAIALCALCLMAALVSGGSLAVLTAMDLGENTSPMQRLRQDMEEGMRWLGPVIVERYQARQDPNTDEAVLQGYYGYLERNLRDMNYELLDGKGKELERKYDRKGSFLDVTIQVSKEDDITYPQVLAGPVEAQTEEAFYAACRELTGKEFTDEELETFYGREGSLTLPDDETIYVLEELDGSTVYLIRDVPLNQDYTVVLHRDMADEDEVRYHKVAPILDGVWRHQTQVVALLGGSLVLFALLAVYLCCAAGHKPGRQEVIPGGLNCVPLDLYFGVLLGCALIYAYFGIEGYRYLLGQSNSIAFAYYGYGLYICCLLFVGFCFACAAQFKAPNFYWWRHSVLGLFWRGLVWCWAQIKKLWHWLGKTCGKLLTLGKRLYGLLPLAWQGLLVGAVIGGAFLLGFAWKSEFLVIISVLAGIAAVIYGSNVFATLLEATKRMRGGDLEIKVDDKLMVGGFKDFAGEINGLSDVVLLAAQKQMRSERMRTELITNVSHDIKTPLTSIINYVDLLQKPHTQQEETSYLEVLSRQSGRMKRLIDDLIELSKASTGNITVNAEKMDAVEAVNQALGEFSDKLTAAHLSPIFRAPKEPIYIHADGRLAWRAMSNLLSNAVKYAQPGTRLYVDMVAVDGRVCVSFKNISRDPLNVSADELMERFVRGEASRNQEGSGLGLNIAKSVMELQHGALELLVDGDLFKATLIFPQET